MGGADFVQADGAPFFRIIGFMKERKSRRAAFQFDGPVNGLPQSFPRLPFVIAQGFRQPVVGIRKGTDRRNIRPGRRLRLFSFPLPFFRRSFRGAIIHV
jgi:hypothetical protein